MTKSIQEQIKEHEQAIERLKAVAREVWKPEIGERYYNINRIGCPNSITYKDDAYDKGALSIGNSFRTEQDAVRTRDNLRTIQAIKDWIAENDIDALSLDWNDVDVEKWAFCCNHLTKKVDISVGRGRQYSLLPHLSSEEKAKACLEFIGGGKIAALYGVYND